MRLMRERFISHKKWVQNYYQDAQTVDGAALPWLDKHASRPFFTLIHYMDPHDPYFEIPYNGVAVARVDTPNPDPSRARELDHLYSSNIEYLDRFIGNMIEALKASRLRRYGHRLHGRPRRGVLRAQGLVARHDALRRGVSRAAHREASEERPGGVAQQRLAGSLDVMPTLLAAAGLKCTQACQGRDLLGPAPAPAAAFAEEDHEGNVLHSIRTDQWKLILANAGNPRGLEPAELYDVANDPRERNNLAAAQPDRVQSMTKDLDVLQQGARAKAVTGEVGTLDDASKERLRALGYIQ